MASSHVLSTAFFFPSSAICAVPLSSLAAPMHGPFSARPRGQSLRNVASHRLLHRPDGLHALSFTHPLHHVPTSPQNAGQSRRVTYHDAGGETHSPSSNIAIARPKTSVTPVMPCPTRSSKTMSCSCPSMASARPTGWGCCLSRRLALVLQRH
jgi:hypothetical protein